jgi:hypothetical protein
MPRSVKDLDCIAAILHYSITATNYGFTEKTSESQNQQAQAAQEAATASPQEAHLAEVILRVGVCS